ncbi:Peptidyl-prolyl cis-trans isomerase FKBP6-like protein [Dinothrombium tinctorium]|uniref:peptidylprolyl isomerase n=1 Tax=Dinothrombium tinctorium TaxID=1965070 RepID=A0A3S3S4Z0_9ACAR|nr:Peptidyl-prolyl cis-trans isomerase FKBP6-like protein [Dinothrombium tinctorium]
MDTSAKYECVSFWKGAQRLKKAINIANVADGIVFETIENESSESEDDEQFDRYSLWWSKQELSDYINDHYSSEANSNRILSFDELAKEMIALTENENGIHKRLLRHGSGELITAKNSVLYHCEAFLDGECEPFDSTIIRQRPFLHRLNFDLIVRGLFIALQTMRLNERAEILVSANYAFGKIGCPPRIPENASVLYIVEILKIFEEGSLVHYDLMTPEERNKLPFSQIMKICDEERISGNSYFKEKKYKEAAFRYRKAIQVLEHSLYSKKEEIIKANEILVKLCCNLANVCNKLAKHKKAAFWCDKVLNTNPSCLKALYHKAVAKRILGDYDTAAELISKAQVIDAHNEDIGKEMKILDSKKQTDSKKELILYKKNELRF